MESFWKQFYSDHLALYQFQVTFPVKISDDDLDLIERIWCLLRRVILHRFDPDDGLMVIFSRGHDHQVANIVIFMGQITVFLASICENHVAEDQITGSSADLAICALVEDLAQSVRQEKIKEALGKLRPVFRQSFFIK